MSAAASSAINSSVATTAATGAPTKRTLSRHSACSSCETGRMPKGTGKSLPVRTARTPSTASALETSMAAMRACGTVERESLRYSMPGIAKSSAKRVSPVTLPSASTRRSGFPSTLKGRGSLPAIGRSPVDGGKKRRRSRLAAQRAASGFDGVEDLEVAGAAADLARERLGDLAPRRARIAIEEPLRRDQHPGRAIAALRGAMVGETLLQRVELGTLAQALDGGRASSGALHGGDQAGENQLAIEDHGAGPAFTELAAVLGARQAEVFPQHLEERLVGLDDEITRLAVDGEGEPQLLARRRGERDEIHRGKQVPEYAPWRKRAGSYRRSDMQLSPPSILRASLTSSSTTGNPVCPSLSRAAGKPAGERSVPFTSSVLQAASSPGSTTMRRYPRSSGTFAKRSLTRSVSPPTELTLDLRCNPAATGTVRTR